MQRGSQLPLAVPARPSEQPVGRDASLARVRQPQLPFNGQASLARPVHELAAPQPGPALQGAAAQLVQPGVDRRRAAEEQARLEAPAVALQPDLQEGSGAAAALRGMQQQSVASRVPQPLQHGAERFRQPESVAWTGKADAKSGRRPGAQGEAAPRPSRVVVSVIMEALHRTIKSTSGQALTFPSRRYKQQDGQQCMTHRWHPAPTTNVHRVAEQLHSSTMRQALHISL